MGWVRYEKCGKFHTFFETFPKLTSSSLIFWSQTKCSGVMVNMVSHESGNHVVRVVEQGLHPQLAWIANASSGCSEVLWLQLIVEETISCSLVNQDCWFWSTVCFHKFGGIISFASFN